MAFLMTIFGICLVVVIYSVYKLARDSEKKICWWKWVLMILWGVVLLLSAGFIGAAIGEGEPQAAMRGGAAFIFFLIVTGLILWRLVFADKTAVSSGGKEQLE